MMTTRTYRQHLRFRVSGEDCRALRERLSAIRQTDNRVHTLRFASYRRPAGGEESRYALHYFDNDPSYLFLERRRERRQDRAILTEAECRALLAGDTDWLLGRRDPLLHDFHESLTQWMLLPRVLVTYRQERFELAERGAWAALNSDMRTTLEHMDFLDPELLERETAGQTGENLLELGFQEEPPEELLRLLEETVPLRQFEPVQ